MADKYIDFGEVKKTISFERAMTLLGLQLKQVKPDQWRGACPACKGSADRSLVITERKGYMCFADGNGGDQIGLVAHIRGCSMKDAANFLAGTVPTVRNSEQSSTVPESGARGEEPKKFQPLAYLEPEHMAVDAIGFCTEFAKKHGVGYAPRGTMKGYVLIPFRDAEGDLLGYIGVQECKLPADFTPNVVDLEKRRA